MSYTIYAKIEMNGTIKTIKLNEKITSRSQIDDKIIEMRKDLMGAGCKIINIGYTDQMPTKKPPVPTTTALTDWQIDVLTGPAISLTDSDGKLKIYRVKADYKGKTSIGDAVDILKGYKKKPIIMDPNNPFSGRFAAKKDVLAILMSREDYPY